MTDPAGIINGTYPTTFGFDVERMRPIPPEVSGCGHVHDFQSYGQPPLGWSACTNGLPPIWVSDYTYMRLLNNLKLATAARAPRARAAQGAPPPSPHLFVSGTVRGDHGTLEPIFTLDHAGDGIATGGPYALEQLDAAGRPLSSVHFDAQAVDPDVAAPFSHAIAADPAMAAIRLSGPGGTLATRTRSPSTPSVKIVKPAAGVHWNGARQVVWEGSDADGDPLTYDVQYSADGGRDWITLASNLTGTTLDVDAEHIFGSRDCRVRVIASDGLNSAVATSERFGVDEHAATARILSARPNVRTRQVQLEGAGADADQTTVKQRRMVWRSNRDGRLGTGASLLTAPLSRGRHKITLTVRARDGRKRVARRRIRVGRGKVPAKPGRLRASRRGHRVTLRWHDRARREARYLVQRGHGRRFGTLANVRRNATGYVDRHPRSGTRYRVAACDARDCSLFAGPIRPLTARR